MICTISVYSESLLLCQWVQGYSPFSLLSAEVHLVSCWSLWFIRTWVLCSVILWIYLNSFTCKYPIRLAAFVEDCCSFSTMYFCLHYQKSEGHRCVDLHLGPFNVCFYANTMQRKKYISHKLGYAVCSFSLNSRKSLISLFLSYPIFQSVKGYSTPWHSKLSVVSVAVDSKF